MIATLLKIKPHEKSKSKIFQANDYEPNQIIYPISNNNANSGHASGTIRYCEEIAQTTTSSTFQMIGEISSQQRKI